MSFFKMIFKFLIKFLVRDTSRLKSNINFVLHKIIIPISLFSLPYIRKKLEMSKYSNRIKVAKFVLWSKKVEDMFIKARKAEKERVEELYRTNPYIKLSRKRMCIIWLKYLLVPLIIIFVSVHIFSSSKNLEPIVGIFIGGVFLCIGFKIICSGILCPVCSSEHHVIMEKLKTGETFDVMEQQFRNGYRNSFVIGKEEYYRVKAKCSCCGHIWIYKDSRYR